MKKFLTRDINLWKCMGLCALISTASFIYYFFSDKGMFVLRDDFNSQMIPFLTASNGALKQWTGEWCWNVDLGTSLIGAYSYYSLGSPFFWVSLLFHKNMFPYIVGTLYIFKYIVAGCTSYLYIKRFVKDSKYAVMGALLYAFSGFQCVNLLFYVFHDVAAFFPLLLLGMEKALAEKKYVLFVFSVFLNCLVNYFFFVGEVIFLVLYFLFRFWGKPQEMLKNMLACVVCGTLGAGMASFLFIPSALFILGNSRSSSRMCLEMLLPTSRQFFYYLKGFLLPGEVMHNQSSVFNKDWMSTSCYLPLVGISLPLAYIWKKRDWLAKLLIALLIIAISPLLSSVFYLFTTNYQRWWYMLVLMMSAASAVVLERKNEFPVRKAVLANIGGVILFFLCLTKLKWSQEMDSLVFRHEIFYIYTAASLCGLLWMLIVSQSQKRYDIKVLTGISVVCFLTTFSTIYLYRQNSMSADEYRNDYVLGSKLKNLDDQYRYNYLDNVHILSGDAIGVYSFNSTVSPSIFEFDRTFGYWRDVFSLDINTIPGLSQLLAAKYRVTASVDETDDVVDIIDTGYRIYYVAADKTAPIGFAYDSYVLQEELMQIDVNSRGIMSLKNLVVAAEDENRVSSIMTKNNPSENIPGAECIPEIVDGCLENSVLDFYRDNSGFMCRTNYGQTKAVYFSVPYDAGWTAFVDGVQADIIKSNGMMAVVVPEGEHHIAFSYRTPGFREGIGISLLSFIVFMIGVVCKGIQKKTLKHLV